MPERRPNRLVLAMRIWSELIRVRILVAGSTLPEAVARLGAGRARSDRIGPIALGRAVHRALGVGRLRPRCIWKALVLFSLLKAQGDSPELVVGLPERAVDHRAHAWVEVGGREIGPPPGRMGHVAMARYA